jgi:ribosome biogenesis protein BMS1
LEIYFYICNFRAADLSERKKHIPLVDRTPVEPPPYVVAIVGPAKVGKSTLLRALVKHYIRHKINEIRGMFAFLLYFYSTF